MNALNHFIHEIAQKYALAHKSIPPKTTILPEGEVSRHIYYIQKGVARMWFNKDGKDITFQFFFAQQAVASIDSFFHQSPSLFTIESIEACEVLVIDKEQFDKLLQTNSASKDLFITFLAERFQNYTHLFLSRIKDTPEERYKELLKNHPEIVQQVPQHYIASYLGITPVSLSRIRNRK